VVSVRVRVIQFSVAYPIPPFAKGGRGGICLEQPHRNPPIPPLRKGGKSEN